MKSDVVKLTNAGAGIDAALQAASASALYRGLNRKDAIRVRLLAEEMLGMFRQITGETEADFWVESEENRFELHLTAHPLVTGKMRKELLKAATSGKNEASRGFMGKLRDLIDRALAAEEIGDTSDLFLQGLLMPVSAEMELMEPAVYSAAIGVMSWSMQCYKNAVAEESAHSARAKTEWDELEKSIVANIADEVKVAVSGNEVEMTVYKSFEH